MSLSTQAQQIIASFTNNTPKMGDIKKLAKEIKKNHVLATELWATGEFYPRLLAILIFDKKQLNVETLDALDKDMRALPAEERNQLSEWLLGNQLVKDKTLVSLVESWENHASTIMRRLFWYYQARLRWTGQSPPNNSAQLMLSLENTLAKEDPEVQYTMNFCACQIAMFQPEFRHRCIALAEKTGLYKDEHVAKNCTPAYLPEFLRVQLPKQA